MDFTASSSNSAGLRPGPPEHTDALDNLDSSRRFFAIKYQRYLAGKGITLCILGALIIASSFAYITASMCFAAGGVLIDNFWTVQRMRERLRRQWTGCQQNGDRTCCAGMHLQGVLSSGIALAALEFALGILFCIVAGSEVFGNRRLLYFQVTLTLTAILPLIAIGVMAYSLHMATKLQVLLPTLFDSPITPVVTLPRYQMATAVPGPGGQVFIVPVLPMNQQLAPAAQWPYAQQYSYYIQPAQPMAMASAPSLDATHAGTTLAVRPGTELGSQQPTYLSSMKVPSTPIAYTTPAQDNPQATENGVQLCYVAPHQMNQNGGKTKD